MNLFEDGYFLFIYLRCNLFVVEDEYTYYLRLYILGYEHFCCLEDEHIYKHIIYVYIS